MEGVERYKVRLMPHNKKWNEEFLKVKKELQRVWDGNVLDIQHVGSTAIPAICAKPILDVAVKLKSIKLMDKECMKSLGYDYCGERQGNSNYHLFVLRDEQQLSLRHIHCYDKAEQEFDLLVAFRDYLNKNDNIAVQYEKLKKELAEKYPNDRNAYTKGKEEFIKSIYVKLM